MMRPLPIHGHRNRNSVFDMDVHVIIGTMLHHTLMTTAAMCTW
jgi:hypothetical protein